MKRDVVRSLPKKKAEQAEANEATFATECRSKGENHPSVTFLMSQNRFDEADQLLSENSFSIRPNIESAAVFRSLGEWHALQDQWDAAANRFETLVKVDHFDNWDDVTLDYLRLGTALAESGKPNDYRTFCEQTISRFAGTTNPVVAERTIKISLLSPPDKEVLRDLEPFAGTASQAFASADLEQCGRGFPCGSGQPPRRPSPVPTRAMRTRFSMRPGVVYRCL